MGLSFLAPAFLLGLGALAVPVVIHLIHRQRARTVEFPSLMFLRRIPFPSVRRRRIRHWALLALRCLALALLVAAFARPFLRDRAAGPHGARAARDVVILLDRSWSMGYQGRWDAARAAAGRVVDGLGPDDRASVVVFDEHARVLGPPTGDHDRLRAQLGTASVGWGRTRYAAALELAGSILDAGTRPSREAVLVSDFQKSGWDVAAPARLPAGATLAPIKVGGASADLAVTDVAFARQARGTTERLNATARVANTGRDTARDVPVTLELGGRAVESRRVDVPPGGATAVAFAPFTVSAALRGDVRVGPDALAVDDTFRFIVGAGRALPVTLLDGRDTGRGLFIRRALAIGDAPAFAVAGRPARGWSAGGLPRAGVVILDDAPLPDGAGRALREWVESGGGLVVVAGADARWPGDAGGLMPGTLGSVVDHDEGSGAALGQVDFAHPVFEPFAAPHSGDFSGARFFRQRAVTASDSARVLARFDDGSVALAERRVGRGRVLLWASTLDNAWNDLALQPVFLPFLQQLVKYAAGYQPERAWRTVGEVWQPGGSGRALAAGTVALPPSGEPVPLGSATSAVELSQAGFWELRGEGDDAASSVIAVNVDPAEADPAALDPQELVAAVTVPGARSAVAAQADLSAEERERRQGWWWYLLAAAFVVLAAETVVSNRFTTVGG